jgi:hypothetical protein
MRIPIAETQIGVVTKSSYGKKFYFTPDYHEWWFEYQCRVHKPARLMTYAQFLEEYPYTRKYGHRLIRFKTKSDLWY